jgi:hypothetical protein
MSLHALLQVSSFIFLTSASPAPAQARVAVEVPAAQSLAIVADDDPVSARASRRRGERLILRLRVGPDGDAVKPADVNELVESLWEALSPNYRLELAAHFGFSRTGGRPGGRTELRFADLQAFLFDRFRLGDRSTVLGRQVSCLSSGEEDLTAVFALVAKREIMSAEYRRRSDVPRNVSVGSALSLAERLSFVCRSGR